VVIYMPGQNYSRIQKELISAGMAGETPCAIVSQATTRYEKTYQTCVSELHNSPELPSPTLLVIGETVRFAKPATTLNAISLQEHASERVVEAR
jgi:siroheme synthase